MKQYHAIRQTVKVSTNVFYSLEYSSKFKYLWRWLAFVLIQ